MIRTFHAKINKKILFFSLLPATVLAIYFFLGKIAFGCIVLYGLFGFRGGTFDSYVLCFYR